MFAIYKRELRAYFTTAVGYVFLAVIVALSAVAFSLTTILQATNDVTTYFTVLLFILMVALPVLTMKLFSEERKMRTEQLLLTAPVSIAKIVAAKFFAAFTVFFGANLLCSLAYITLFIYSEPEGGIILGNIIAITLVGAAFIAVGIFVSSLTENQLAAAIGTFGILIPIVVDAFSATDPQLMIIAISACMAGAVCGDHCSPISDTTIMASAGAQCEHVNHVSTQLPYAITAAAVSCVSYIVAGYVRNVVISLIVAIALMLATLSVIKMTAAKSRKS